MARIKLNHPRRVRVEPALQAKRNRLRYETMATYPEPREIIVTNTETGTEEKQTVTVQVALNRAVRRINGARGERLNGPATLIAGFPQKRAVLRVTAGRLR